MKTVVKTLFFSFFQDVMSYSRDVLSSCLLVVVDEDGAAKSSSGKGMSAEGGGGDGGCRGSARWTKKLLARGRGRRGTHCLFDSGELSRFRGVSVVKLLAKRFFFR